MAKKKNNKVNVKGHYRKTPSGKTIFVQSYTRKRKKSFSQVPLDKARKRFAQHLKETSLDVQKTSNKTYWTPPEEWYEDPSKSDVYGLDAKTLPVVDELPDKKDTDPKQVVSLNGEIYVADKDKEWKKTNKKRGF